MHNTAIRFSIILASGVLIMTLLAASFGTKDAKASFGTKVAVTGRIAAWQINENGDVAFQVIGKSKGKELAAWYEVQGNDSNSTQFDEKILWAVLNYEATPNGRLVTATGEKDAGVSGKSADDALALKSLSRQ